MQTIAFNEFLSGEYKEKKRLKRKKVIAKTTKIASSALIPIATGGALGTLGVAKMVFASDSAIPVSTVESVPVGAKEWMGEQTLSTLAHVLDPVIDILVALSFPIASVVIVGACFLFMFGNSEKAWAMIQIAGLGYVLIQVSPLILDVLKQVGNAV